MLDLAELLDDHGLLPSPERNCSTSRTWPAVRRIAHGLRKMVAGMVSMALDAIKANSAPWTRSGSVALADGAGGGTVARQAHFPTGKQDVHTGRRRWRTFRIDLFMALATAHPAVRQMVEVAMQEIDLGPLRRQDRVHQVCLRRGLKAMALSADLHREMPLRLGDPGPDPLPGKLGPRLQGFAGERPLGEIPFQ